MIPVNVKSYIGMGSTVVYVGLATLLAYSAYSLSQIANTDVMLGRVQQTFTREKWNIPIMTLLQGKKDIRFISTPLDILAQPGTQSLADLQYEVGDLNLRPCP
ncbi:TPA: hypothetical protein N0F65_003690 [Lagenidium giganteum]|uniref:Uncharacterized protein n=1 Tax=Lagenidium giganteum TaxID=4803 RepID=A0AAV2YVI3_9STRA|nr:TPA: hypothetical protein N0F65_003690 [Lagenidium giganteum]